MSRVTRNNTAVESVAEIGMLDTQQEQEYDSVNSGMITHIQNLVHPVDTTNTRDRPFNLTITSHQVPTTLLPGTSDFLAADTLSVSNNLHRMTHHTARNPAHDRNRPGAFNTWAGSFNPIYDSTPRAAIEQATAINYMPPLTLPVSRYLQGYTAILLSMRNARTPRQDTDQQNEIVESEIESERDSNVRFTSGSESFEEP